MELPTSSSCNNLSSLAFQASPPTEREYEGTIGRRPPIVGSDQWEENFTWRRHRDNARRAPTHSRLLSDLPPIILPLNSGMSSFSDASSTSRSTNKKTKHSCWVFSTSTASHQFYEFYISRPQQLSFHSAPASSISRSLLLNYHITSRRPLSSPSSLLDQIQNMTFRLHFYSHSSFKTFCLHFHFPVFHAVAQTIMDTGADTRRSKPKY